MNPKHPRRRIGFISTRLAGTDGVSLETTKWVKVLTGLGHECFFLAGESDWAEDRTAVVDIAHFTHPYIQEVSADLFDDYARSSDTSGQVHSLRYYLKPHLYDFINKFDLELLIIENALALPMNVPLGLALTEVIAETSIPTIAHHHDFYWERERYAVNAAQDYLRAAFPPLLPSLRHVVINSVAGQQLALRTGASSTLIPNVMDFNNTPPEPDGYADDLREHLGISAEGILFLQPTRVVPRKRIEKAIELVRRLEMDGALVITHSSGDEGSEYAAYLQDYAKLMGVQVLFAEQSFGYERQKNHEEEKTYSLRDGYQQADLVTYPSTIEGFGNAFLEAIFFKRPLVMSTYSIYRVDIQPKGFRVIAFNEVLDRATVDRTKEILMDPALVEEIVTENYELGRRHYSFQNLETQLVALIHECLGA
jgi:glycosyltransferase involved in cell wall biosynthesis